MTVDIECNCGTCIISHKSCPMFGCWGFSMPADAFCSFGKAFKKSCNYCTAYVNDECTNAYLCGLANELMEYSEGQKILSKVSFAAQNMGAELGMFKPNCD